MGEKGVWERWGVSKSGVAALAGVGGGWMWAASGHLRGPPGLLRTVGKWYPVWGGLEDGFHLSRRLGVGTPFPRGDTRRLGQWGDRVRVVRAPGCASGDNADGQGTFLMPSSEEVTQHSPGPRASDLPFRGCEKLGAFSEASFKTDISVGKKESQMWLVAKDLESL